jgi:hypothetical protein
MRKSFWVMIALRSAHHATPYLIDITLFLLLFSSPHAVGNKRDLEPHEVTDDIVELFVEQFPQFNGYFKISCKTDAGIEEMINEITNVLSSSTYSFKDTFDAFTLHGQHTSGECCSNPDPDHDHQSNPNGGNETGSSSCCAK